MKKLKAFYRAWNQDQIKRNKVKDREIKVAGMMKILFSTEDTNETVLILEAFKKKAESKLAEIAIDSEIIKENINEYFKNK